MTLRETGCVERVRGAARIGAAEMLRRGRRLLLCGMVGVGVGVPRVRRKRVPAACETRRDSKRYDSCYLWSLCSRGGIIDLDEVGFVVDDAPSPPGYALAPQDVDKEDAWFEQERELKGALLDRLVEGGMVVCGEDGRYKIDQATCEGVSEATKHTLREIQFAEDVSTNNYHRTVLRKELLLHLEDAAKFNLLADALCEEERIIGILNLREAERSLRERLAQLDREKAYFTSIYNEVSAKAP